MNNVLESRRKKEMFMPKEDMAIRDLSILLSDEESEIRTSALELIELLLKECSLAQLRPFALSLRKCFKICSRLQYI